jgi:RNA polymerase sigma factor (sigma-70 family)
MREHDAAEATGGDEGDEPASTGGGTLAPEAESGVWVWLPRVLRRRGAPDADAKYRKFHERNKHVIWACVNGPGISRATAQDHFQEVCAIIARRMEKEGEPNPVAPYVKRIVTNLRCNLGGKRRPEVEVDEAMPTSRPDPERRFAATEIVETVLAQMKPKDAWIVRMIDLRGEPYADVARQLGCSEQNAILRHHRAMTRFKALAEPLHRAVLGAQS